MFLHENDDHNLFLQELYGWTMDAIVREIGLKNNCKLTTSSK